MAQKALSKQETERRQLAAKQIAAKKQPANTPWFGVQKTPEQLKLENEQAKSAAALKSEQQRMQQQRKMAAEEMRLANQALQGGMAQGATRGKELFSNLGRLEEGRSEETTKTLGSMQGLFDKAGTRSEDIQNVLAQRRSLAAGGFAAPEFQAMREAQTQGIAQGEQTAARQLRASQAASGLRGGAAAAQLGQLQAQGQQARTQAERDLFLQNEAQKRANLGALEQSATGAESNEFGRQQSSLQMLAAAQQAAQEAEAKKQVFNIGQKLAEAQGQQASELGYGQLSAGQYAAAQQAAMGQQQLSQGEAQKKKADEQTYICGAIKDAGLVTPKEFRVMRRFLLRSMMTGRFYPWFTWYRINGKKAVEIAKSQNFDWATVKSQFFDEVLTCLENDGIEKAQELYAVRTNDLVREFLGHEAQYSPALNVALSYGMGV